MTTEQIAQIVEENRQAGRFQYEGLKSHEIGEYNHSIMFGDSDDWDEDEWSVWVD